MITCDNCKHEVQRGARWCENCGKQLDTVITPLGFVVTWGEEKKEAPVPEPPTE
jgi:predicted amidophosphoribosyltransferase